MRSTAFSILFLALSDFVPNVKSRLQSKDHVASQLHDEVVQDKNSSGLSETDRRNRKTLVYCDGGNIGNGVCADGNCCSQYGWCGTGPDYCTGTCGGGSRGNGVCLDNTCCSQYGWCGTGPAYCSIITKKPTRKPTKNPAKSPTGKPTNKPTAIIGYYKWTWSSSSSTPLNSNIAVAFSGWANVNNALQESSGSLSTLKGTPYLSIGGGDASGRWTSAVITSLNNAITSGKLGAYKGVVYDIEEGDSGLSQAFARSFATAKQYGFKVLVTISHSAPYGVSDARTLMLSFFTNVNIDYISPQLYTSGTEAQNDYTAIQNIAWSDYKQSHAAIVPSIVQASYYSAAKTYFSNRGITLSGFIQWKN